MKKAFDQTVRDLKRGVNKKVLKVPSIEQKVLDATSNEPWGPHGSLLADVAQATRNYHEYQMIMSVLWKRINDTGKNWRHVYKALTVLEYLIAHGSERVIDEIREHAYQISTLSDFQYIDSSGKDQGNNVRKKSQSLVVLANDKERIQEVRQKAASNREKYRNTPVGGMYRPGSSPGYGDRSDDDRYEGRYGNRDDDRNGYGRERDGGSRDDDKYGRYGDSYGHEGDKYSRDYEERYGRDGYRDDEYRGRGQNVDDYRHGSRSRSADQDRDRISEDDGQYSSRGSGAKADDNSQDGSSTGKRLDRKYSDQNLGPPPSYEEVVGPTRSPTYSERDVESSQAYAPKASSPAGASPSHTTTAAAPSLAPASPSPPASVQSTAQHSNNGVDGFDEFDPRGSFSATPTASNGIAPAAGNAEMDFFGSLSDSLALVPTGQPAMTSEANASDFNSGPTYAAASSASTPFDDPFGDGPFKAVPTTDSAPVQQQIMPSTNSIDSNSSQSRDVPPQKAATTDFVGSFYDSNPQFVQHELSNPSQDVVDILADILPPSTPSSFVNTHSGGYTVPPAQSVSHSGFPQTNQPVPAQTGQPAGFPTQLGQTSYPLQSAEHIPQSGIVGQTMALTFPAQAGQAPHMGFNSAQPNLPNSNFYGAYHPQPLPTGQAAPPYMVAPGSSGPVTQHNYLPQMGSQVRPSSLMNPQLSTMPTSIGSSGAIVPQPSKFETKSTVWADTLSRGLVDLNISGTKTNPLADIGVDFDSINRRDKRMEKPTTTTVTSTVTMGKAMGSGSGIGRAGAGALRPPPNAMVGPGMGGYGVSQQPMGRGMGMGMNIPGTMGMGMGMNMGMVQGINMQQQPGYPPASTTPGGYNQMMGTGNYGQQPYGGGGGYR